MADANGWLSSLGHASLGTPALSGSRPSDYPHVRTLSRVRSNAWFRAGVFSESADHLLQTYFYRGKRAARNRGLLAA